MEAFFLPLDKFHPRYVANQLHRGWISKTQFGNLHRLTWEYYGIDHGVGGEGWVIWWPFRRVWKLCSVPGVEQSSLVKQMVNPLWLLQQAGGQDLVDEIGWSYVGADCDKIKIKQHLPWESNLEFCSIWIDKFSIFNSKIKLKKKNRQQFISK